MQDQKRRDKSVDSLAKTMRDIYVIVHESDALKERKTLKSIIIALSKQTIECAYFIQKYATDHNFCACHSLSKRAICILKIPIHYQILEPLRTCFQKRTMPSLSTAGSSINFVRCCKFSLLLIAPL
jgi:hypothetical protein